MYICVCTYTHTHIYTHSYVCVCNKVRVSKMKCPGAEDVGGRWPFLASKTSEPEQREPSQPQHPKRRWWSCVLKATLTRMGGASRDHASPTWTKVTPREPVPHKLWGDLEG